MMGVFDLGFTFLFLHPFIRSIPVTFFQFFLFSIYLFISLETRVCDGGVKKRKKRKQTLELSVLIPSAGFLLLSLQGTSFFIACEKIFNTIAALRWEVFLFEGRCFCGFFFIKIFIVIRDTESQKNCVHRHWNYSIVQDTFLIVLF